MELIKEIKKGKYRHHKGEEYEVLCFGYDSETLEEMVIYQALYDSSEFGKKAIWVRSKTQFLENVTIDGEVKPRFEHL